MLVEQILSEQLSLDILRIPSGSFKVVNFFLFILTVDVFGKLIKCYWHSFGENSFL